MSILIRGMELPESCWSCQMFCNCYACEGYECHCAARGEDIGTEDEVPRNKRRDDCPLVPVPPHGRLIDADELRALAYQRQKEMGIACCVDALDIALAPTIIPAEENET